jgi:Flp pilus assembly protein TadG
MSSISRVRTKRPLSSRLLLERWKGDSRGVTAIEFAIVAVPFLMLLFGIIGVGLYFFTTFTLENGVEQSARLLRTGQAQNANYSADEFKQKVCDYLPGFIDCQGKVVVNVLSFANASDITTDSLPSCTTSDGQLNTVNQYTPGGASQIILVWACYEWELGGKLPYLNFGSFANGASLIQASTVFRAEPYGTSTAVN